MIVAVQAALLADPGIALVLGTRVYLRRGNEGGISSLATPEAFNADGDLLPSLVVTQENRALDETRGGDPRTIRATQTIALWCYQQRGYTAIKTALRHARRVLHQNRGLEPVEEVSFAMLNIRWGQDTGELVDETLGACMIVSRYDALVVEHLSA